MTIPPEAEPSDPDMTDDTALRYQGVITVSGTPHPLADIDPDIIRCARAAFPPEELHDPEMYEPIADAVLIALVEAGHLT